jgi:hypothetical protein
VDRLSGALTFVSYRDPNLLRTLEAFDGSGEFLRSVPLGRDELSKAIIGTIGDIDRHHLPDAAGHLSMLRHLTGQSEERLQHVRDEVLGTTEEHFRTFADVMDTVRDTGIVKVLGSRETIEAVSAERPGWLELQKVL